MTSRVPTACKLQLIRVISAVSAPFGLRTSDSRAPSAWRMVGGTSRHHPGWLRERRRGDQRTRIMVLWGDEVWSGVTLWRSATPETTARERCSRVGGWWTVVEDRERSRICAFEQPATRKNGHHQSSQRSSPATLIEPFSTNKQHPDVVHTLPGGYQHDKHASVSTWCMVLFDRCLRRFETDHL